MDGDASLLFYLEREMFLSR